MTESSGEARLTEFLKPAAEGPPPEPQNGSTHLAEILITLARWRWLLVAVFALTMLGGLVAWLAWPQEVLYTTSVEIGKIQQGNAMRLVEQTETARGKLLNSYIPHLKQTVLEDGGNSAPFEITVTIPKKTDLLVLKSSGPDSEADEYVGAHRQVLEALIQDHQRSIERARSELEGDLGRARVKLEFLEHDSTLEVDRRGLESKLQRANQELQQVQDPKIFALTRLQVENKRSRESLKLEGLKDDAVLYGKQMKRIEERRKLLEEQAKELEAGIQEALAQRQRAVSEIDGESQAMVLLLIDTQIQQNRDRLAELKEELYIDLDAQKEEIEKAIEDNLRSQATQQEAVDEAVAELEQLLADTALENQSQTATVTEIQAQLENLTARSGRDVEDQRLQVQELERQLASIQETRAVTPTFQSSSATVTGASILLLAAVLGVVLAVFAVYLAEVVNRTRRQLAELER